MSKAKALLLIFLSISIFGFDKNLKLIIDNDDVEKLARIDQDKVSGMNRDQAGRSPLLYALQYRKEQCADYLINRKLGVNSKDYLGRSPLHVALANKLPLKLIKDLVNNSSDVNAVDMSGKGVEFYLDKSTLENKAYLSSVLQKIRNDLQVNISEIKAILKEGDAKKLSKFLKDSKTLTVKIDDLSIPEYLIENDLIEKWSMDYLLSIGLDFFHKDIPHKLLRKKFFQSFKELQNFKINILKNSKDESLLEVGLKNGVPSEILVYIVNRQLDLSIVDKEQNNYLHLAYRFKRYDIANILKKKGVSSSALNLAGETPLMLLVQNEDNQDILLEEFRTQIKDATALGKNSSNAIIQLCKKMPEVAIRLNDELRSINYNFSHTDNEGNNAVAILRDQPQGVLDTQLQNSLEDLPVVSDSEVEQVNLTSEYNIDYRDSEIVDNYGLYGDRVFDEFIFKTIESYISDISSKYKRKLIEIVGEKYTHEYIGLMTKESSVRNKLKVTISEIKKIDIKLKDQHALYLELVNKLKLFNVDSMSSQRTVTHNEVQGALSKLISFTNYLNEDLVSFSSKKSELEAIVKQFKEGKDEFSIEIKGKESEIAELQSSVKLLIKSFQNNKDLELKDATYLLEDATTRTNQDRKNLDDVSRIVLQLEKEIENLEQEIRRQTENEKHPNHKPETCQFTKIKDRAIERKKLVEKSRKSTADDRIRREKYYNESLTNLNEKRNNLSKMKASVDRDIRDYESQVTQDSKLLQRRLKDQIAVLEYERSLDKDAVLIEADSIRSELVRRYGNISDIESNWKSIKSFTESITDMNKLKDSIICSIVAPCFPKLLLKGEDKLSLSFNEVAWELANSFNSYNKLRFSDSEYSYVSDSVARLEQGINLNKTTLESKNQQIRELNNTLQEVVLKLKNTPSIEGREDIDRIVSYEENKIRSKYLLSEKVYDLEIEKLKTSLVGIDDRGLEAFIEKYSLYEVAVNFNTIVELENIVTGEKYPLENKAYILTKWYETLIKNHDFSNLQFISPNSKELFIAALYESIEFYFVEDSRDSSVMLSTGYGKFVLDEFGMPSEITKKDSPFSFELVSTGAIREKIISITNKLNSIYPNVTLDELKANQNLSIVLGLLKTADKLNDIKKSQEILDIVETITSTLLVVSPTGVVASTILGLGRCAYDIHTKVSSGLYASSFSNSMLVFNCFKNIFLLSSHFSTIGKEVADIIGILMPTKNLTKIITSIFEENSSKAFAMLETFLESVVGVGLNDLDNKIFLDNGNLFLSLQSAMTKYPSLFTVEGLFDVEIAGKMQKSIQMYAKETTPLPAYILNEKYLVSNLCHYSESSLRLALSKDLEINVKSFTLDIDTTLLKGQKYYVPVESLCVQIRKI